MRSAVALAALATISAAAQSIELPSGLTQIVVLVLGGLGLRWYFARAEKRLKESLASQQEAQAARSSVDRQEVLDRMQQAVLADTEARIEALRADLHKAERDNARLRVEIGKRDDKIRLLSSRIERLSDQLLALEQGRLASKRRGDPGLLD